LHEMNGEEKPVPVMNTFTLSGEMDHHSETVKTEGESTVVEGSEYLGTITTTAACLAGTCLFSMPITPALIGGARLAAMARLFDLYEILEMIIEYVPMCASTTAGNVIGFCTADIAENPMLEAVGEDVVRNAMARPGSATAQVFSRTGFAIALPQQAVYFTEQFEDANLAVAGSFYLTTPGDLVAALPLGLMYCHYKVKFSQATFVDAAQSPVSSIASSVWNFGGAALAAGQTYYLGAAFCTNLPLVPDALYQMVIGSVTGGGVFNQVRTLEGQPFELQAGTLVYTRWDEAGNNFALYPSFSAAASGTRDFGVLVSAGGYAVLAGRSITFERIKQFILPDSVL